MKYLARFIQFRVGLSRYYVALFTALIVLQGVSRANEQASHTADLDARFFTPLPDAFEPYPASDPVDASDQHAAMAEILPIRLGYDGGFIIVSDYDRDIQSNRFPFLMRINSWFHLRHTLFDSDGPNPDENEFEFERLRLIFSGHVYSPDLEYFLQIDGDGDDENTANFQDYYTTFDIGHHQFGREEGTLAVRLGKWKMPFSRSRHESGRELEFTDRSVASIFFDVNRSVGVGLVGRACLLEHPCHYEAAAFNGLNTGGFRPGRNGDLDRNFGYSTRLFSDLLGDVGDDGEPNLLYRVNPALRVGMGFAFSRVENGGLREFNVQRVIDTGATLASLLPVGVDSYNFALYTVDAHFKYRGFSFITDYYWRRVSHFLGGVVPDLFDQGVLLQMGYFVVPKKFEILARWSRLVGDSSTLGIRNTSSDEVAGGLAWYFRGNNAKLVFDVTHLNGAPIDDATLNIMPGDRGWLYRTQFQLAF